MDENIRRLTRSNSGAYCVARAAVGLNYSPSVVASYSAYAADNLDEERNWQIRRICDYLLDYRKVGQ